MLWPKSFGIAVLIKVLELGRTVSTFPSFFSAPSALLIGIFSRVQKPQLIHLQGTALSSVNLSSDIWLKYQSF